MIEHQEDGSAVDAAGKQDANRCRRVDVVQPTLTLLGQRADVGATNLIEVATESFLRNSYPIEHLVPEGADLYDWVTWTGPNHDLRDPGQRHALARLRVNQGYTIIAGLDTILALD